MNTVDDTADKINISQVCLIHGNAPCFLFLCPSALRQTNTKIMSRNGMYILN